MGARKRRRGAANPAFRQALYDQLEAAHGAGDIERAKHIARRLKAGEARS
ncbi:MAG: hypothetical protein IPK07_31320 [Deltaproteobacteria bacterium]|nr:hypothetical protein [Deltaproteobacteria bacterium]